mmetsp:Transcript_27166/g.63597  ORF Transcript_27166/g.63597 Transcript_27166/m.63597 type:complete len:144 (-) Transcript_27166:1251-1682(-)
MSYRHIEIRSSQPIISVASHDIAVPLADVQNGNVECATTKIVHQNLFDALLFVQAIGQSRSGGFFQHAGHRHARELEGLKGSLALMCVELGRDRQNGRPDIVVSQKVPRQSHQKVDDVAAHLLRREGGILVDPKDRFERQGGC